MRPDARVEVAHSLAEAPRMADPAHLAVGMFDGVHLGHQAVIEAAVHQAQRESGRAGVLTFSPHPSRLFRPEAPTRLLQPLREKLRRLASMGLDFVIVQDFDAAFAGVEAGDFPGLLTDALPTLRGLYVGENFRYGRGRQGDVERLIADFRGFSVDVFSAARIRQNGDPISSTRIRAELEAGNLNAVNRLLGYPYTSSGTVTAGRQLGRTLGFPTLNLPWSPELPPPLGVYGVCFRTLEPRLGPFLTGIANYGLRPTVETQGDVTPLLEVHALADIFEIGPGTCLEVQWLTYIRPEQKFDSLEALKAQIAQDVAQARQFHAARGQRS